MQHVKIFSIVFILCCSIIATQTVTRVEISRDNGIIFNQSGEMSIIKERWKEQQKFDFSIEQGNCPTICGARCLFNVLSKDRFYIYKSNQDSFPFYGRNIDLQDDGFYTSSQYSNYDTIQFVSIPLDNYPKYMLFKSTVNKYFLFIIDSHYHPIKTLPI